ncbi:hypothetical protein ONS95_002519 [Cadophora gregata]|uniref:uncharacterized protein n=1 Tax=Cadophora gregata TaxID=51156 RepID=UPI0026DB48F8|nr:uncharacterized protein ONS95_002519 [Cadophora gregata]KAK0109849.1 hypothetical protein ONS95_002519 [Cadophora gregata]KAK0110525.1 hypothetical protein ONS96_002133 [Cadophora gregata f. sp. sojae]
MTSGQARQTRGISEQRKGRSSEVSNERKEQGQHKQGASTSYQDRPDIPQQPSSQASQTSHYQSIFSTDLPPSSTWPNPKAIPSHREIDYSLLGLTSSTSTPLRDQSTCSFSPYCRTTHRLQYQCYTIGAAQWEAENNGTITQMHVSDSSMYTDAPPPGYGMTAMGRWSAERQSQQGALLAWEKERFEDSAVAIRWGLKRF